MTLDEIILRKTDLKDEIAYDFLTATVNFQLVQDIDAFAMKIKVAIKASENEL